MQFLQLAVMTVLFTIWSHVRTWHYLPLALYLSLRHGGLFRWLFRTLTGFRWLERKLPSYQNTLAGDKIHFLRTGSSDAILLESDGKFALVDAAEDSAFPAQKPHLAYVGWEDYIVDYVKRVASGKLDFVLGTHAHSDHIGGFDTLINDPEISVGRAYLKYYDNASKEPYERDYWDNQECYEQMMQACRARGVPVIKEFTHKPFVLGNFRCTIFNGEAGRKTGDENDASLGLLIEHSTLRAFLAGDINNVSGNEQRLRKSIGRVDLLKAAHHGYDGSSTLALVTGLMPRTVVFANHGKKIYPTVKSRYMAVSNSRLMATCTHGGVAAVFHDREIKYYAIGEYVQAQQPQAY